MVLASLTEEERDAMVKMLQHEHFAYGVDGMLALAGFKKIRDTPLQDAGKQEGNAATALEVLKRLRDLGCPTYLCRDGSRTRDGALLCTYCDGTGDTGHAGDCVWPALLKVTGP
jgi:hypothetical protein